MREREQSLTIKHLHPGCECPGKICERCHELLCVLGYSHKRTGALGRREKCKPCHALARDEQRSKAVTTPDRVKQLRKMSYADYLKTPEWQAKRGVRLKAAKFRCQICNAKGLLNVHHRSYTNLGNEQPADLIVLCAECHKLFHENRRLVKDPEKPMR